MAYKYEWKVRAGDTDFSGRIYTPNAIDCLVEGVQDMIAAAGNSDQRLGEEKLLFPAVHAEVDYEAPVRIDDVVNVALTPSPKNTSVSVRGTASVNEETVFKGELVHVFVSKDGEPYRIPDDVREGLETFATKEDEGTTTE